MLAAAAVLYTVTAVETVRLTPAWLAFPRLWATVSFIAAVSAASALLAPLRPLIVTAGTFAVMAAVSRSAALIVELVHSPPAGRDAVASFGIAAAIWATVAILFWQAFATVVIPWAAVVCRRPATGRRR